MKKRLISMVMTAVMTLTLVVAAAPVVANAAADGDKASSNTTVSYEHSKTSAPAGADYSVKIPASITFTSVGQTITTNLELVWAEGLESPSLGAGKGGEVYAGSQGVDITIGSSGSFALKNGTASAPYTLKYGENTNGSIGALQMDATTTTIEGTATLSETELTTAGSYTDVLTFTLTHVTSRSN